MFCSSDFFFHQTANEVNAAQCMWLNQQEFICTLLLKYIFLIRSENRSADPFSWSGKQLIHYSAVTGTHLLSVTPQHKQLESPPVIQQQQSCKSVVLLGWQLDLHDAAVALQASQKLKSHNPINFNANGTKGIPTVSGKKEKEEDIRATRMIFAWTREFPGRIPSWCKYLERHICSIKCGYCGSHK